MQKVHIIASGAVIALLALVVNSPHGYTQGVERPDWVKHPAFGGHRFDQFPSAKSSVKPVYPKFAGPQRSYRMYRTRFIETVREGPTFAGYYSVSAIGCGSGGCVDYYLINLKDGSISHPFPADARLYHLIYYELGSRLLLETFQDGNNDGVVCLFNNYILEGASLKLLSSKRRDYSQQGLCP